MILRWPCGRAGPAPRCRPGSAARSAPRRASGRSKPPSRPSPSATLGSPCPCRPHRRTAPRVLGGPGACWCRRGTYLQSARRRPACGADRSAVSCSSTPSSCRLGVEPGPRKLDFGPPEGPHQRTQTMAMPVGPVTPTGLSASPLDCERRPYRGRISAASNSPSTVAWMNSRTRSRTPDSIGSNQ